ncbi:hypothetical protein BLGI_2003 [Brevibacillus laterosporus GI-9]|nr:hypothetical protein BLGI_2003 [Brevibacillus laterosporus GI-9]
MCISLRHHFIADAPIVADADRIRTDDNFLCKKSYLLL